MIPDSDYFLAKARVRARREAADTERLVREVRREAAARETSQAIGVAVTPEQPEERRGAFGWLRRLAGAR